MRTVTLNGIDLKEQFGVLLLHRKIGEPVPNTYSVDVPGRNGKLDYTDFFGETTFQNRTIELEFYRQYDSQTPIIKESLEEMFNGKVLQVIFSDDPTNCWEGRAVITENDDDAKEHKIVMVIDCEPFKKAVPHV